MRQKENFLETVEGVEGLNREIVNKLIEEYKLYEYSIDAAEIMAGLKIRVDRSWKIIIIVILDYNYFLTILNEFISLLKISSIIID